MHRKIRFKLGSRVNAISLASGKSIYGEYRGVRMTYGAYVFGIEVGSFEPAKVHICCTLTMVKVQMTKPKGSKKRFFKTGDPCTSITKDNTKINGFYMNGEGKFAWIRGWQDGVSKFMPKQAYKVLTSHLTKLDALSKE